MTLLRILASAATMLLTTVAPAAASAPWSPPQPIRYGSTSTPLRGIVSLTANADDGAIAVADIGGTGLEERGPSTQASLFSNGVFLDPQRLTPRNYAFGPVNGAVAAYRDTRLIGTGIHFGTFERVDYAFGRLTKANLPPLGRMRSLGPARLHAHGPALAVNAAGDAAIVYPVCRDQTCERVLVYLAQRRRGTSTFHSTRLYDGRGPLPRVSAAINERGDALAAWSGDGHLYARVRTAGGRLRSRQTAGDIARSTPVVPTVALSKHRAELIGWVDQLVSNGDGRAGQALVARARDGDAVHRVTLSQLPAGTGRYVSDDGVDATFGPRGQSLVAFTAFAADPAPGHFEVRAGELSGAANSSHQQLVRVQVLSDPALDTILGDFVVGPQGGELALMATGVRGHDPATGATSVGAQAAVLTAGPQGPWVREQVADPQPSPLTPLDLDAARLSGGRVLVSWTTPSQDDVYSQRLPAVLP
jgi:hypothetical protein